SRAVRAGRGLATVARAAPGRYLAGDRPAQGMARGGPSAAVEGPAVRRLLVRGRGRWPRVHADQGEGPGGRRLPRRRHRKDVWRYRYHCDYAAHKTFTGGGMPASRTGPRATPAVDAGRVYALGATGILLCLEAKTGKKVWQQDLLKLAGSDCPR